MRLHPLITAAALAALLGGCAATPHASFLQHRPELGETSKIQRELTSLPLPPQPIAVAVYGFADQTGQFKPSEAGQSLSRAVSQGGSSILVKALQDAGQGSWFSIVEREHLDELLKERQIIREMRSKYMGEDTVNPVVLPPMLYAGVIFSGGIIGFDSNTITGGAGAKFLGIGGNTKYKQDTVSVYLRAISTKTGEVLASVVVRKSIASIGVQGDAFRFVDFKQLLEAEVGVTNNEPAEYALQQAIQKAVLALILEGNEKGLWDFAEPGVGTALLDRYDKEKGIPRRVQIARRDPLPIVPVRPEPAPSTPVSPPGPVSPLAATRSGDPELSPRAAPTPFDPAAAATRGGSSGIATSAAGIPPPASPQSQAAPENTPPAPNPASPHPP